MNHFDCILQRNKDFAAEQSAAGTLMPSLPRALPNVRAIIVGCADMRVDPAHVLAIEPGEDVVMRNIGGRITPGLVEQMRLSPKFLEWLRRQSGKARRYGSVCTGALVLAEAGLLNGRRVTTHWNWCRELQQKHPKVKVDPRPIYIRDKNLVTSAGVTAGIDLPLALVEDDLGGALALQVAQMTVVFLRHPGGQSQFSAPLMAQARGRRSLRDLLARVADNLGRKFSVSTLARRAPMSPRNFARIFREEIGETPARHIETLRVEAARRHLETTVSALEEVAEICGFGSAEILRRTFFRRIGTTPGKYRSSFAHRR
jgi:transcriptional regulator GlxA family with amidase domain